MSLDLEPVAAQISKMIDSLRSAQGESREKLERALRLLNEWSGRPGELAEKRRRGKADFQAPEPTVEGLATTSPLQAIPANYHALGADGSHIDVDRHHAARCCLINIGTVKLTYGAAADAALGGFPLLHYGESQTLRTEESGEEGVRLEGAVLAAKRAVDECRALADLIASTDLGRPTLALLDGSLILWQLEQQKYQASVYNALLQQGLVRILADIRAMSDRRMLAFGSYISSPGSSEVVNLLRIAACPFGLPDCSTRCARPRGKRECGALLGLRDSDIFAETLGPGVRSAVFVSHSDVLDKHYGEHGIGFFYLNVCDEIARIEMPLWLAGSRELVDLAQSLVFEQCRLGDGYPVVLAEAHQKAVITAADREQFWRLVESSLEGRGIEARGSAKSRSKRRPFV